MKRALIITTISGFLAQFELKDVEILQELGYEVHYASNFDNPVYEFERQDLEKKGIILHHIDIQKSPARFRANAKAYGQIRSLIQSEGIDLIHCHNPVGSVVARLAAKSSRRHPFVIYTAHGFHFFQGAPWKNWLIYYNVERCMARITNMLITINREDYERACRFQLKKPGYVEQIPGVGVDLERFRKKSKVAEREGFHIVTAAELNENKNQKVIIEAIHRLPYEDITYSICGKGVQEEQLRGLIEQYQLQNRVHLLGYRKDMEQVLQTADCFAFPSYREGLGIAAIEALACGVPLIAARNRGTKEYLQEGVNGIFCEAGDVESFMSAIEKLYQDREYIRMLAEGCRKTALGFGVSETKLRMQQIYKKADWYIEDKRKS